MGGFEGFVERYQVIGNAEGVISSDGIYHGIYTPNGILMLTAKRL